MGECPAGASAVLAPESPENTTRCTKMAGRPGPRASDPNTPLVWSTRVNILQDKDDRNF